MVAVARLYVMEVQMVSAAIWLCFRMCPGVDPVAASMKDYLTLDMWLLIAGRGHLLNSTAGITHNHFLVRRGL